MTQFEDLDWGPIENKNHDLGTDLFVQVRERRFDIGVVLGAQVKTSKNGRSGYFRRPQGDRDTPDGWWYAENSKDHFDYWKTHTLPHLLILRDHSKGISYWVHVTPDAVVDTGVGAKILVPRSNTLDAEHLDALMEVASTGRPEVPLEGTAWLGGAPAAFTDQLRYALMAPRLIASRQMSWVGATPTPAEVVAMMARAHFDFVRHLRKDHSASATEASPQIPTFDEARTSPDWCWRFVAAFESRILHDDLAPLENAVATADSPDREATAVVALAAALIERGRHQDAVRHLTPAIESDDKAPIDQAWLLIQRARAHLELGDLASARADADKALGIRDRAPHDVTATAIDGAARALIFGTASWEAKDYGSVIQGSDTAVAWWRGRMTISGLTAVTERTFKAWASDRAGSIGTDDANNQLYVASLAAGHAGDHGAWRRSYELLAQDTLLRLDQDAPPEDVANALRMLRQAGADKSLQRAVIRIADDGPCRAITMAGDTLDLDASTHTTFFADLMLVKKAGDLFSVDTAERCLKWLAERHDHPERLLTLTGNRSLDLQAEVLETIHGLVQTIPGSVADFVASALSQKELDKDLAVQILRWQSLLHDLPSDVWTPGRVESLLANGLPADGNPLRFEILSVAKHHEPQARGEIENELRSGSLKALIAANYVADLDTDLLDGVRAELRSQIEQTRTESAAGVTRLGGLDPAYVLGVIVLSHPSKEDAGCIASLLADPRVATSQKHQVLDLIARRTQEFRELLGDNLLETVEAAGNVRAKRRQFQDLDPDIAGPAMFIVAVLNASGSQLGKALSGLLAGSNERRRWAARLLAQTQDERYASALIVLAHDPDPLVRAQANGGLTRLAVAGLGGDLVVDTLQVTASEPGRAAPIAIAAELGDVETLSAELETIRISLLDHPSAAVRLRAARRA